MTFYPLIKQIHILAALASIALFGIRFYWSVAGSGLLQRGWVKVVPHVIDTVLLIAGVTLMIMLKALPAGHPWMAAKLIGLVVYILLGTVAIKRGPTPRHRLLAGLAAIMVFFYIFGAARLHTPWSWLAG